MWLKCVIPSVSNNIQTQCVSFGSRGNIRWYIRECRGRSANLTERNKTLKLNLVTSDIFSSAVVVVSHWRQQLPRHFSFIKLCLLSLFFFLFRQPSIKTFQIFWNLLLKSVFYPVAPCRCQIELKSAALLFYQCLADCLIIPQDEQLPLCGSQMSSVTSFECLWMLNSLLVQRRLSPGPRCSLAVIFLQIRAFRRPSRTLGDFMSSVQHTSASVISDSFFTPLFSQLFGV